METVSVPETAIVPKPRSEKVQRAIEQGFAEMASLREERDHYKAELDRTGSVIREAKDKFMKMQEEIRDLKSRCTAYQLERDDAVIRHGKLQGLFVSMLAQMRAFEIPVAPVIHERISPDAENTNGGKVDMSAIGAALMADHPV